MKKKLFLTALFLTLQIITTSIPCSHATVKAAATENPGIQPYNKKTGYKYKKINGRLYKRLWSFSQNKWLEPEWTPVP